MAELEYGNRDNLFNVMKTHAPDGSRLRMVQNLMETNDVLVDFPSLPSNANMFHKGVRFVTLPSGTVISVGGGWASSFADLQPYTEGMMIVKSRYQVPTTVLDQESDPEAYVSQQSMAHVEGLNQGWANQILAGVDSTAPEKIAGLQNRAPWNDISETDYVYDVGGSSNLRSGWLMNPGPGKVHLLHPKNDPNFGIFREDKGEQFVTASDTDANATGKRWDRIFEFGFTGGINIPDQKCVKRIANIDNTIPNMTTNLIRQIISARVRWDKPGPWFFYCDWSVHRQLILMAGEKNNVQYSRDNPYRVLLPMIGDVIIRRWQSLETAESLVT